MDEARKTDLGFKLLDNVQGLIKFADAKINVLLIISGITTSFILANFQGLCSSCLIAQILLGLFFLSFIVFVIFAIVTISPRPDGHTGNSVSKLIYFGHIANRVEAKDFIADYKNLDEDKFQTELLYQVFENSKIADKKFRFYGKSLYALMVQITLFLVLLLVKFYTS